jgi:hypothetical protein
MKKMLAVLAVLIGLFVVPAAKAETTPGLIEDCQDFARIDAVAKPNDSDFTSNEWISAGYCLGFVTGVAHGASSLDYVDTNNVVAELRFPEDITPRQLVAAFLTYVKAHPEVLDKEPTEVVAGAFIDAGIMTSAPLGTLTPSTKKPTSAPTDKESHAMITAVLRKS